MKNYLVWCLLLSCVGLTINADKKRPVRPKLEIVNIYVPYIHDTIPYNFDGMNGIGPGNGKLYNYGYVKCISDQ